ncbi:MAG: SoxR reducing system RseC family protein [Rikenellaceae bacterium]
MSQIEHKGIVSSITTTSIEIEIAVGSACEKCHIKGACQGSSENEKRVVVVDRKRGESYEIGEKVTLFFSEKEGLIAAALAYVIPIIISVIALTIMIGNQVSEPIAALISLAIIVTYFIILYIFRHEIKRKIEIKVEKIEI